jgi:hypothetical protein
LTTKKIFMALGNERPQILIQLEDCVLQAIIAISEGKSRVVVMDYLYSQVLSLQDDLAVNKEALAWFNIIKPEDKTPPNPTSSQLPQTPSAGQSI